MEKSQKEVVYEKFDNLWKGFKGQSLVSGLIIFLICRQAVKILSEVSPKTILEMGCGRGRIMLKFKESGFKVIGIDNSKKSIAICKAEGLGKEVFEMDILQNSFDDSSFDVVFSHGLLEHFENYEPFVKEMFRVSNRYILLIQPNYHSLTGKILNIVVYKILKKKYPIELPYKMTDYIESFEKYNCKLVLQRRVAFGTFTIFLFQKLIC